MLIFEGFIHRCNLYVVVNQLVFIKTNKQENYCCKFMDICFYSEKEIRLEVDLFLLTGDKIAVPDEDKTI